VGDGRKPFKVGHLFMLQGKDHVEVPQALPGDIVAVAKVDEIHFDAVLHDAAEDDHIHLKPLDFPVPVHGLAIEPKRHGDEQRMWEILASWSTRTLPEGRACGQHQRDHRLRPGRAAPARAAGAPARVLPVRGRHAPPRIAYRETITAPAEGHHRHKKQTGGAGQFGEVFLRIEPLPRGGGFEFVDEVKGGTIPGQFIPAVEKGVREVLAHGAIAGYPVVDVRVDGLRRQAPQRGQQGDRLRTAGRKAFMAAIRKARPIVLEPIVAIEISAPDHAMGDITGDLSSKRGMVTGTANRRQPARCVIKGQAPMSELAGYQNRLNAMTAGQGRYTIALSHYEAVPPAVQQQLTKGWQARDDD
jgi:elongation factor G